MSRHIFGARDARPYNTTRRKKDLWKFVWQHACFHSLGRITVRRKKRRHCNFTFKQNPAYWRKGVSGLSGAVFDMKPCLPGTLLFTLLRNTPEDDVLASPRSHFREKETSQNGWKGPINPHARLRMVPWNLTDVGHLEQLGHHCSHWMEDDAGEVHHPDAEGCVPVHEPLWPSSGCRSASEGDSSPKAPPSRGHRGPRTLHHQLSTYAVMWKKRPTNLNPEISQS